jgi:hypothetical protein
MDEARALALLHGWRYGVSLDSERRWVLRCAAKRETLVSLADAFVVYP